MRRTRVALLAALAALSVAVVLTTAASAGKPAIDITAVTTQSEGEIAAAGTCYFSASVTYTSRAHRGDIYIMELWREGSFYTSQSGALAQSPSELQLTSATALLVPANYKFQIYLQRDNRRTGITTLDAVATSTFYMSGCPSAGTSLGTYPIP